MSAAPVPLSTARVLLVGVGGLGCPAALALATAGVGVLGLADDDVVDLSNLHRQILFREADVGADKLDAAAGALKEVAPGVSLVLHRTRLLPENALALVCEYDCVAEGSDNFATKFLVADACKLAGVPVVHAAAVRWHGTALAVSAQGAPCYRCLFEDIPRDHAPNCAEAGVIGPMVGVVGSVQAELVLDTLQRRNVGGTLVTLEGKGGIVRRRTFRGRANCELCGAEKRIGGIQQARYT